VVAAPANFNLAETDSAPKLENGATRRSLRLLFGATVFLGAFLLFLIEPLIAKLILPWFGGGAAVWATCLVFFQSALLLGYFYADATSRRLAPRRQAALHIALLVVSLICLPVTPRAFWRGQVSVDPAWRILGLLTFSIGLPFVLLSATSPLVQAWYARRAPQYSPYHLFSLSNLASLLALLSFPFLIERRLTSHQQAALWSIAYGAFVVCCALAARLNRSSVAVSPRSPDEIGTNDTNGSDAAPPTIQTKLLWLALSACGSMTLLSVTNHLSENITAVPLLWVAPLALYLLSFAVVFAKRRLYSRFLVTRLMAVALGGVGYAVYDPTIAQALQISVPLFLVALFIVCLFCHGELAQQKPQARDLTSFYLVIALGGAVGAVCVGLIAPHVLSGVYELPIVLLVAAALAAIVLWREGWSAQIFWTGVSIAMCVVLFLDVRGTRLHTILTTRNFYGALRIRELKTSGGTVYRELFHGTIKHGAQFMSFPENRNPTTYYGRRSGVGLALRFCCDGPKRVGVIGLGTGTLAAYGKPGDSFRFYDINPEVVRIARDWFTFLKQSPAKTEIVLGDARLSLESEAPQQFDVLAVDAFSGDAIPVHLLTREAFAVYFRHLKPDGILAVHTSNTYLNLTPVVKLLADDAEYATRFIASDDYDPDLVTSADWVLVTRNQKFLNVPETFAGSANISVPDGLHLWTDDRNSLFEVLRPISYVMQGSGGS
jgi:SAM-dependent methyltransferase